MPKNKLLRAAIVVVLLVIIVGEFVFRPPMSEVSISAETLWTVAGFPITNAMLTAWIVMIFLIAGSWFITRNLKEVPTGLQGLVEFGLGYIMGLVESVAGKTLGRKIFPLIATIFIFVLFSNWFGLLPFFGTAGIYHEVKAPQGIEAQVAAEHSDVAVAAESAGEHQVLVPFFRSPSTDLNFTIGLALISVVSMQIFGVKSLGLKHYAGKFFNFKGPLDAFVGLLEIVSEFAKIISLAFRLFGNVFAGEVLLLVIGFLVPWLGTIPFMGLEVFIGGIQAFIFAMLTLVFIVVAVTPHAGDEH